MARQTDDVALAAYLRTEGFNCSGFNERRVGGGKRIADFVYRDSARLNACWDRYERGEARVEPRTFALAFRAVRDDLFAFLGSARR